MNRKENSPETRYFGDNIKHLRRRENITQETLAKALNVTPSTVSYWEGTKRRPVNLLVLKALCEYFKVSLGDLLLTDLSKKETKHEKPNKKEKKL